MSLSSLVVLCTIRAFPRRLRRCRAASRDVLGCEGKSRTPEQWPESSGRGIGNDFLIETFFCHGWSFSCSGASPGGSRRCRAASKEVSGGQGKSRAPEWWPESSRRGVDDDIQVEAFFCQVCRCLLFWGVSSSLQEVSSCLRGGLRSPGKAQSSRMVA